MMLEVLMKGLAIAETSVEKYQDLESLANLFTLELMTCPHSTFL